jgi:hypothetical protein
VRSGYKNLYKLGLFGLAVLFGAALFFTAPLNGQEVHAQHPTLSIPTVTGTPSGPVAQVWQNLTQIPVRSGPGPNYPEIGLLVAGQRVPALGSSLGGEWVQIYYPGVPGNVGWVFGVLVEVRGPLDQATPPASPTPLITATLNPTLAGQMPAAASPTRLPTYTEAPPIIAPTYQVDEPGFIAQRNIPTGFIIVGLAVVGLFGTMLSLLRGR